MHYKTYDDGCSVKTEPIVYASDSIYGLLDQIDLWSKQGLETVEISLTDLRLLKECYLEEMEELI